MEKKVEKALDKFVVGNTIPTPPEPISIDDEKIKKVVIDEREGLVERVDKIFVTKDGKQLLREQY